ncbi:MAG TPA: zf-HC2 domain-containing protein [Rhodanobacteraceae bacterium]|nr:zf-HC2 domain-containing protein [Rhodanobacteraceae bacterium]
MTIQMNSGKDCARAWEIMPWVLQATAVPGQREWLMHHLAQCEACSAEFAQQSRLRCALSLPTDVPVDAESGLKRLLERIDTPETEATPVRRWSSGNRLTRALAAAVVLQAIGIGALSVRLWSDQAPQYRTLSQPALLEPAGALRVVPAPGMKLADWNKLLHDLGLRVIDGPNDAGAYAVVPAESASSSASALRKLRADRDIRLAEPVDNTP